VSTIGRIQCLGSEVSQPGRCHRTPAGTNPATGFAVFALGCMPGRARANTRRRTTLRARLPSVARFSKKPNRC
jgi:hypothetical protein